ncbi:helix-turn-helix domain-containing protein [Anaerocolumna sp.]|uniref:helix-turn-helix domain-containing protein n=1 Tax=Anaerocolumna sp. TaxID=2041569 RepID=UPI0028AD51A7|nr:helix-turn-helix transcriptional regulator [Anaerocolumna sp.]
MRIYLKHARKALGLTQEDVANALGISQNYYCDIENSERQKEIKVPFLIKLSTVLQIPIDKMLSEEKKLDEQRKIG